MGDRRVSAFGHDFNGGAQERVAAFEGVRSVAALSHGIPTPGDGRRAIRLANTARDHAIVRLLTGGVGSFGVEQQD
jgi:hypothetical protein